MDHVVAAAQDLARSLPQPIVKRLASTLLADNHGDISRAEQTLRAAAPLARHQRLTSDLIKHWRKHAPDLPEAAIAGIFLATEPRAPIADELALVWSGPTVLAVPTRRTDEALIEVIDAARSRLSIVSFVAYRVPRVREAIGRAAARGVHVNAVLESPEESAFRVPRSGAEAVSDLTAQVAFYVWPRDRRPTNARGNKGSLHAKFAVADRRILFVSSANLTQHALALNMELGVLIAGGALPEMAEDLVDGLVRAGDLTRSWPERGGSEKDFGWR